MPSPPPHKLVSTHFTASGIEQSYLQASDLLTLGRVPIKVCSSQAQQGRIVFKEAKPRVAVIAQQATYFTRVVVVVNSKVLLTQRLAATYGAATTLSNSKGQILCGRDVVLDGHLSYTLRRRRYIVVDSSARLENGG